jgi:autoinducer 2 (AI-2) kinase
MDAKRWVQAAPSFVGFDVGDPSRTGRAASIRAIEEQAAFVSRAHLGIVEEMTGRTFDEIVFTGGGAKGRLWPRIVADTLGVAVRVPVLKESTALGGAIFAGVGSGVYRTVDEAVERIVRFEGVIEPDPANRAVYDESFGRWHELYQGVLALTERGLAQPMWWPAGADAVERVGVG